MYRRPSYVGMGGSGENQTEALPGAAVAVPSRAPAGPIASRVTATAADVTRDAASSLGAVLFVIGILLATFVLPQPWGLVAIGVGAALDIAETGGFLWWSKRRRAVVGVETLVGKRGVAVRDLWPEGQVKVGGEIWKARCEGGCNAGNQVIVREVDGLMLVVEPISG